MVAPAFERVTDSLEVSEKFQMRDAGETYLEAY